RDAMSGFWGAETEAVRQQGEACAGAAGALETLLRSCGSQVATVEWIGADADGFRERWSSEVDSRLQQAIEMLRAHGEELRRHGDEQDEASADDGGGGVGLPGIPLPTPPGFPSLPGLPGLPNLPIPTLPGLPGLPGLPEIPSLPLPPLPDIGPLDPGVL